MLGEEVPGSLGLTEPQQRVCEGGASVVGLLGPVRVHEACSGLCLCVGPTLQGVWACL